MKGKHILNSILCFFFPERCIFCNAVIEPHRLCCDKCAKTVHPISPPLCPHCGCSKVVCDCGKHRHHYQRVIAPFYYEEAVRGGILRLKRWDDPKAIDYFSKHMAAALRRECPELPFDGICYMPMTKEDRFERQYNQSQLLAKAVGKAVNLPVKDVLVKRYQTTPQKRLKLWQRKGNVLGAFDVVGSVKEESILLIDDLLTSGASLDECAKMLLIYGARSVTVLTAAVTPPEKEKKV